MATLEMLRNLRVPTTTPGREVEPIVSFGNGDSSSDDNNSRASDEDPSVREYLDSVFRNAVSKLEESQKKQLKKRIEDENNKRDYRCVFVNSRTCARCTDTKYKDSLYCKKHKSYVKKQKKSKEVKEMSSAVAKEKKEVSMEAKKVKQMEVILLSRNETMEKAKEVKQMKRKIADPLLQFKVASSKTLEERFKDEDLVSEEESPKRKPKKAHKVSKEEESEEEILERRKPKKVSKKAPKVSDDKIIRISSDEERKKPKKVSKKVSKRAHKVSEEKEQADTESEFMEQDNPVDSPTDSVATSLSNISLNSISNHH